MPTTSPKYPTGTATDISGAESWTNLATGLNADDGTLLNVTTATKNSDNVAESGAITFTSGEIPSGDQIDAVTLEWEDQTSVANGSQIVQPYLGAVAGTAVSHAGSAAMTARSQDITAQRPGGGSWTPADFHGGTLKVRVTADQPNNTTSTQYRWDYVRVVVTHSTPAPQTPVGDIVDDFEDGVKAAIWTDAAGVTEERGRCVIAADATYPARRTETTYTLADSGVVVKVPVRAGGVGTATAVSVRDSGNTNGWRIDISNDGNLYLVETVGGVVSSTSVAFNALAHAYLRIRHSSGTGLVYWEGSPDGLDWTAAPLRSKAPGTSLANKGLYLYAGGSSATGTSEFESVNVPPAPAVAVITQRAFRWRGEDAVLLNASFDGAVTPAPFPSLLRVENGRVVDENGYDLGVFKGWNTNVASTVANPAFTFSQAEFDKMSTLTDSAVVPGPGVCRFVVTWDVFEQSQGVFHGITSPTSAATAGSAFDSLDKSIARAEAAGRYSYLDLHLLGGSADGRVPAWARTGTVPSGSGSKWSWFCTNGQGITETLAARYGDPASPFYTKSVIGYCPNEPPATTQDEIMDGFEIIVPWYRDIAPDWPIWVGPFSYGGGTPYPSAAADVEVARLLALDTHDIGCILDWRTYMVMVGSASPDGYQGNGSIGPEQQVTNGAWYYGWGVAYNYPDTTAARTAMQLHIDPLITLRDQSPRIALAATEFGSDHAGSATHDQYVRDIINSFRNAGSCFEIWWQWGNGTTTFDASPGGVTRPAISGTPWMLNPTVRA